MAGCADGEAGSEAPPLPSPRSGGAAGLPLGHRAVWGEVGAVLAVGVVPHLVNAMYNALYPFPPPAYWIYALYLTVTSGCTVFVTLYLIHRSGEPWERFGLPRGRDAAMPTRI